MVFLIVENTSSQPASRSMHCRLQNTQDKCWRTWPWWQRHGWFEWRGRSSSKTSSTRWRFSSPKSKSPSRVWRMLQQKIVIINTSSTSHTNSSAQLSLEVELQHEPETAKQEDFQLVMGSNKNY